MEEVSRYDYSNISDYEKSLLPLGYKGDVFNISYKWTDIIQPTGEPIKIMEIGTYHGANVCSLMKTYATNPKSEIHCVDPWFDYAEYDEYKTVQASNYSIFLNNMCKLSKDDLQKIYIHRGLSENIVPRFEDESFDIIYVDGNHQKKFVIEDEVLSFKKLKKGGWMVIDDLQSQDVSIPTNGFYNFYVDFFDIAKIKNTQLFLHKKL